MQCQLQMSLKIVMSTMFVKVPMSISDTTQVESAKVRTRFVPNRPLKRPANNDKTFLSHQIILRLMQLTYPHQLY